MQSTAVAERTPNTGIEWVVAPEFSIEKPKRQRHSDFLPPVKTEKDYLLSVTELVREAERAPEAIFDVFGEVITRKVFGGKGSVKVFGMDNGALIIPSTETFLYMGDANSAWVESTIGMPWQDIKRELLSEAPISSVFIHLDATDVRNSALESLSTRQDVDAQEQLETQDYERKSSRQIREQDLKWATGLLFASLNRGPMQKIPLDQERTLVRDNNTGKFHVIDRDSNEGKLAKSEAMDLYTRLVGKDASASVSPAGASSLTSEQSGTDPETEFDINHQRGNLFTAYIEQPNVGILEGKFVNNEAMPYGRALLHVHAIPAITKLFEHEHKKLPDSPSRDEVGNLLYVGFDRDSLKPIILGKEIQVFDDCEHFRRTGKNTIIVVAKDSAKRFDSWDTDSIDSWLQSSGF